MFRQKHRSVVESRTSNKVSVAECVVPGVSSERSVRALCRGSWSGESVLTSAVIGSVGVCVCVCMLV